MTRPLPQRRYWIILAVILLLAAGSVLAWKMRAARTVPPAPPAVVVADSLLEFLPSDLTQASLGEIRQVLTLTGTLRALRQAAVKARVSGEVREVLVREGEPVTQGQVLVRMDDSEFLARLQQTEGALNAALGQLEIAAKARDSNRALLVKNFISKNAYDNTQSQYAIATANVESAKGARKVTQKLLGDTTLRAPITGVVSRRSIEPGEKVAADNRLLDIVDLRQMELEAAVPAADIIHIALGQEVQVRVEGLPPLAGKVSRINPAVQAGSRSVPVYIQLDNPQGVLRVGMFGQATLTLAKKTGVLTLPASAVREEAGRTTVYAIENGRLQQKTVVPGLRGTGTGGDEKGKENNDGSSSAALEIVSGLAPGATVVKTNLGNLQSGSRVNIIQPATGAALPAAP